LVDFVEEQPAKGGKTQVFILGEKMEKGTIDVVRRKDRQETSYSGKK